jgi:hypothetical protein
MLSLNSPPMYAQDSTVPVRPGEITTIRGDLYQVRDRDQVTVFLVTPGGVILADPLNPELARWLKTELEARFPGRPVRYVLHSSHRYERAAGAWAFDAAEIVAHANFSAARSRAATSLPRPWIPFDRNQNAVLERSEAVTLGADASSRDRNRDGEVSAAEVWGEVSSADSTYRGRQVIDLGGRRVELIHPGDGLGIDATVMLFSDERILFAPGVPLQEVPASFETSPQAFVDALRQVERLQFDTLLSERGETRTLADLGVVREYAEAMLDGVKAGLKKGDTVEQIQASLGLERFNGLRNFDVQRGRNIADMYRRLRLITLEVAGAAELMQAQRGMPACAQDVPPTIQAACKGVGGPAFAGTGGLAVMAHRVGGALEITKTGVVTGSDQRFTSNVVSFQSRETVTGFMFRYEAVPTGRLGVIVTAGMARISATHRGDGQFSFFGPSSFETTASAFGGVFGSDLAAAMGRFRLIVPVRVMRAPGELYTAVGGTNPKWNIRTGIGVSVPVVRGVL